MGNEKKIRLIRAAKEFNVGLNTITDFLHRKGIEIDSSPNTPIDADTYAVLEKEFGKNRPSGSELDSVREKINKKTSVSIEPEAKPKEEKREIEVKKEVVEPKILGKNLGVHPLLTLVVLYTGYSLFGFVGILTVPVFLAVINVLLTKKNTADVDGSKSGK